MVATRFMRSLRRDADGISAVEFALVAPVFFTLLIGSLDLAHWILARSQLNGAVNAASRSSALESGNTTTADAMVLERLRPILPGVTITSTRRFYFDFSDIGRAERWTDANGNGTCDNRETFIDENGSHAWENDVGSIGNGGANDVVVYTVTARFSPVFKIPFAPSQWNDRSFTATAVRKNQPYALQNARGTATGQCI